MINSPELREILRRIITCSEAAASVGKGKFGKDLLSIHWEWRGDGWSLDIDIVHPELSYRVERTCDSQGRVPAR